MIKVGDRKKNNCTTQICKIPLNKGIKPRDQHQHFSCHHCHHHHPLCKVSQKQELKVRSDSIEDNTGETRLPAT